MKIKRAKSILVKVLGTTLKNLFLVHIDLLNFLLTLFYFVFLPWIQHFSLDLDSMQEHSQHCQYLCQPTGLEEHNIPKEYKRFSEIQSD